MDLRNTNAVEIADAYARMAQDARPLDQVTQRALRRFARIVLRDANRRGGVLLRNFLRRLPALLRSLVERAASRAATMSRVVFVDEPVSSETSLGALLQRELVIA